MQFETLPGMIVRYPDPRLRQKCERIETFDDSVAAVADRMLEIMKANEGVGLAGPQVGIFHRIFVANPTGEPKDDLVFINPELSDLIGAVEAEEGCLSLPDIRCLVRRARRCHAQAQDETGKAFAIDGEELIARICQHENDHLDGRLIIDYMDATDKIANKKQLNRLEADFRKAAMSSR